MLAKHALSQLSYGPYPGTSSTEILTNLLPQLEDEKKWWAWEDLNFRPHAYQARALTN